ncbi:DUF6185 family protein [Streptomyces sp. NPDC058171]
MARTVSAGLCALALALLSATTATASRADASPTAPVPASAPEADPCTSTSLAAARVSTTVRLEHRDRTFSKIVSELRVEVPGTWPLAGDLLLSENSERYVRAMSCLSRPEPGQHRRWHERRSGPPIVSSSGDGGVTVVDRTHSWVNAYREHLDVGVWRIRAGAERWTLALRPPTALKDAHWHRITVDPGGPGAHSARPRPDGGSGTAALVWRPPAPEGHTEHEAVRGSKPDGDGKTAKAGKTRVAGPERERAGSEPPAVTVSLEPPWQRSWAAQSDRLVAVGLDRAAALFGTAVIAALLLYAHVLYRRRPAVPTAAQERTLHNLAVWAVALVGLAALTLSDDVLARYADRRAGGLWQDVQTVRVHAFALGAAAVLFCTARPTPRIWRAGALLTLPPAVVAAWPHGLGLYVPRSAPYEASVTALLAQALAAWCLLTLTLLGFTAAAWRLATDGGLLPTSRRFPGRTRVLRLRIAGPVILVWSVVVAVCWALTQEREWQRAAWLSDRTDPLFGVEHRNDFVWETMWSAANAQDWLIWCTWLLSAVAILAVLRTWRPPAGPSPAGISPLDAPADRLLLLTFFAHVVALVGGYFLSSSLLTPLWIPLSAFALYGTVALFTGRSVLAQPFERSARPLAESADPAARAVLLEKSRSYREIHAELRRLDQGMFGDVPPKRIDLEARLNALHDWPAGGGADRLPAGVSVVDGALALGPRDDWWANGSRCARLSLVPAVPASLLMTWAWKVSGEAWQSTLQNHFGLPDVLLEFVFWMATWTGAAFVMGTLWRHLPGRRGAAKALPVTVAFALPVGVDVLVYRFTGESTASLALSVSTMLLVLTVTGIGVDFDTFRGERRYWQSRLGLLLSVYQMRYYSLQVAYLIAQVIALITIWEFLATPDATPGQPGPK